MPLGDHGVEADGRQAVELFEATLDENYMLPNDSTVVDAWNEARLAFAERNEALPKSEHWKCPSLAAAYRWKDRQNRYEVMACREGVAKADQKFKAVYAQSDPFEHNEVWEIDHTLVDCVALDDKSGIPIGCPYITSIIDRATRVLMGYFIDWSPPSRLSVFEALRCAMLPKEKLLQRFPGIQNEWPAYGVPQTIVPDNAKEFIANEIAEAAQLIGFSIDYAPVACGSYKGRIERLFQTLSRSVFHRVPGSTYGDVLDREGRPIPIVESGRAQTQLFG